MKQEITDLVESYERGGISRRELIGALALMALGARVSNSAPAAFQAPFQAIDVNHVALNVTDATAHLPHRYVSGVIGLAK